MTSDSELLRRYAQDRSEAVFAEIVGRHVDLVYSAACRRVGGDPHLAAEVTQEVFLSVARRAERLARHPVLNAWLHTSTRNAAANLLRRERRRASHHREIQIMQEPPSAERAPAPWAEIGAGLDAALDRLSEGDRHAIVLKYFENRTYAEIGRAIGLREEAARMRVARALEKLRGRLQRQGITSTAAALGGLLSAQAVSAAPPGLASGIAGQVTATAGAASASGLGLLALMKTTPFLATLAGALALLGAAGVMRAYYSTPATAARSEPAPLPAEEHRKAELAAALRADAAAASRAVQPPADVSARPAAGSAALRAQKQKAIVDNLRLLSAARDQFVLEQGRPPRFDEVFGPDKFIRALPPADGENYAALDLANPTLTIVSPTGIAGSYASTPTPPDPPEKQMPAEIGLALNRAAKAYRAAHNGQMPGRLKELLPYFETAKAAADFLEWNQAVTSLDIVILSEPDRR